MEVKTLDAQQRSVLCHLHIFRSKMPGFQAHAPEYAEDEFLAFHRGLAA